MTTSKQTGFRLLALGAGLAFAMVGCSRGDKAVMVRFTDCPTAVQKAINAYAEGVKFYELDRETHADGRVDYRAKGKRVDGAKIEIQVSANGQLLEFRSDVDER